MKYVLVLCFCFCFCFVSVFFPYCLSYAAGAAYAGECSYTFFGGEAHAIGPFSGGACGWNAGERAYYGEQQPIGFSATRSNPGDEHTYVPVSGKYSLQTYYCIRIRSMDSCSIGSNNGRRFGNEVYLESTIPLSEQKIVDDIPPKATPSGGYNASFCVALVASDSGTTYGGERISSGIQYTFPYCSDTTPLPTTPGGCILSNDTNLDVDFGLRNRDEIATISNISTDAGKITKSIQVNCTGNIPFNAKMELKYTPATSFLIDPIATSTKGLGVSIMYNNKFLDNKTITDISFQPGINNIDLDFYLLRSNQMEIMDIATGDFTANAVLVFTEQ